MSIHTANCRLRWVVCWGLLGFLGLCGCGGAGGPSGNQPVASSEPAEASQPAAVQSPATQTAATAEEIPEPLPPVTEAPQVLSEAEVAAGWIALFDGETLFGWKAGSDANWRVEAGTIVVDSGEQGLLCTTSQFADYELELDFQSAVGTNSGIFLHTPLRPQDPARDCYELNIADRDNPFPTGSLVKRQKVEGTFDSEDWQHYRIKVVGGQVQVYLDDQLVMDYTDPQPLRRGHIGLQLNEGRVAFRNIRLRPLGTVSIFNGTDLTGWKTYPEMESEFSVESGLMRVRNGRGQLETEKSYGDFVLRLEYLTHAADLNSGIFFRCIPGDVMMGYESQIHDGYEHGDRRQPKDCGTGGIFRRQNARLVVGTDGEWVSKTLIVNGPHMAAWVNGYQVSDWTDEREAHENQRKGLRQEPGTIMIQGHDPTTDLSFRGFEIGELPARQE